jgi:hypothetical protein
MNIMQTGNGMQGIRTAIAFWLMGEKKTLLQEKN